MGPAASRRRAAACSSARVGGDHQHAQGQRQVAAPPRGAGPVRIRRLPRGPGRWRRWPPGRSARLRPARPPRPPGRPGSAEGGGAGGRRPPGPRPSRAARRWAGRAASRSREPPSGSGVPGPIPAASRAAVLATAMWPQWRTTSTGCPGAARSSRPRSGRRRSARASSSRRRAMHGGARGLGRGGRGHQVRPPPPGRERRRGTGGGERRHGPRDGSGRRAGRARRPRPGAARRGRPGAGGRPAPRRRSCRRRSAGHRRGRRRHREPRGR